MALAILDRYACVGVQKKHVSAGLASDFGRVLNVPIG